MSQQSAPEYVAPQFVTQPGVGSQLLNFGAPILGAALGGPLGGYLGSMLAKGVGNNNNMVPNYSQTPYNLSPWQGQSWSGYMGQ
jgi:hypothetical protein